MRFKSFLPSILLIAVCLGAGFAGSAHAGTARVEWFPLGTSGALPGEQELFTVAQAGSAETDTTSTGSAVTTGAAPSFLWRGQGTTGVARVTAISGDAIVRVGATASQTAGVRIPQGQVRFIAVQTGQTLSILQDSNATPSSGGGGDASAANQVTGNTSLASIVTNTTGAATSTNQTVVEANPGSDSSKALAVQGVTGGKAVTTKQANTAATYRYFGSSYAAYATPTDLFCIAGAAGKVITVTNFGIKQSQTTAAVQTYIFIRRSTLDTSGASTNPTGTAMDAGDSAHSATLTLYTAAPTLGAAVGNVGYAAAAATVLTGTPQNYDLNFVAGLPVPSAVTYGRPVTLRSATDQLCANFAGAALPGGYTAWPYAEWTEQ